jgi:hypothetical protein
MDQDYSLALAWDYLPEGTRRHMLEWAQVHSKYGPGFHMGMLPLLSINSMFEIIDRVERTVPLNWLEETQVLLTCRRLLLEVVREQQRKEWQTLWGVPNLNRRVMYNDRTGS